MSTKPLILSLLIMFTMSCNNNKTTSVNTENTSIQANTSKVHSAKSYEIISQWYGDGDLIKKLVLIKRNQKYFLITEYVDNTNPLDYSDDTIGTEMATENNKEFWDVSDTAHGFIILDNGDFKNTNPNDSTTIYKKL